MTEPTETEQVAPEVEAERDDALSAAEAREASDEDLSGGDAE